MKSQDYDGSGKILGTIMEKFLFSAKKLTNYLEATITPEVVLMSENGKINLPGCNRRLGN